MAGIKWWTSIALQFRIGIISDGLKFGSNKHAMIYPDVQIKSKNNVSTVSTTASPEGSEQAHASYDSTRPSVCPPISCRNRLLSKPVQLKIK